jgi:two-component system response regulator YesN
VTIEHQKKLPLLNSDYRLLIIDDVSPVRQMIRKAIESYGITSIAEAESGLEGLIIFERFSPNIVLLDIEMKGMNGIEVLQKIRETSSIPIIIMTGYPNKTYVQQALQYGMTDFLVKPIDINRLHTILFKSLGSS